MSDAPPGDEVIPEPDAYNILLGRKELIDKGFPEQDARNLYIRLTNGEDPQVVAEDMGIPYTEEFQTWAEDVYRLSLQINPLDT